MSGSHPSPSNPFDRGYFETADLLQFGFAHVGERVKISKNASIFGLQNISLDDDIRIDDHVMIVAPTGSLKVGRYVHIGAGCFLGCTGGITLSDFSGLSQGVRIYSCTDDYSGQALTNPTVPRELLNLTIAPVHIGRHVIVGSGTVILPGVSIGDGSSVGALSLVTKSLEEWGVHFGSPAKRLKARSKKLLEAEMLLKDSENRTTRASA